MVFLTPWFLGYSSGVTKVGVTRGGGQMTCVTLFFLQTTDDLLVIAICKVMTFLAVVSSLTTPTFRCHPGQSALPPAPSPTGLQHSNGKCYYVGVKIVGATQPK